MKNEFYTHPLLEKWEIALYRDDCVVVHKIASKVGKSMREFSSVGAPHRIVFKHLISDFGHVSRCPR